MLELYKDGQPIFYNMVNNAIKNNKLSHAYIFDSTRVNPIKNRTEIKNMITESVNSLAIKKLKNSNVSFDNIPKNSGGIIDINNQKIGIYKDTSRKYFCCKTYLYSFRLFTFLE